MWNPNPLCAILQGLTHHNHGWYTICWYANWPRLETDLFHKPIKCLKWFGLLYLWSGPTETHVVLRGHPHLSTAGSRTCSPANFSWKQRAGRGWSRAQEKTNFVDPRKPWNCDPKTFLISKKIKSSQRIQSWNWFIITTCFEGSWGLRELSAK